MEDPCDKHAANGLMIRPNNSFRFPNFARIPHLLRIITHESDASEFAHAAFFSFRFSLCAPHRRFCRLGGLSHLTFSVISPPKPEKSLVGVRLSGGFPLLIAKFSWGGILFSVVSCVAPAFSPWMARGPSLTSCPTPFGRWSGEGLPQVVRFSLLLIGATSTAHFGRRCLRSRNPPPNA